ncbi:ArsR/SmtB family transcription factor [Bacillus thuringiensis]|uniref:Transcriptional regulator n=1 Tax=Bacillus thuringiensis subsp. higo TaxID=132266 RepID=A0A9X6QW80_BACUH|nr:metalloregulator ArsR/SmtB family transcription factor [Bacillus thuringiensis]OUB60638.1 transcriptional regulator [Bacillus thuringiensis serovar higo]
MFKSFNMDLNKYERSADILRGLGHPIRLQIIHTLVIEGPLNVSELWRTVQLPQSLVSQHLIKLKRFTLVSWERKGNEIYYRVDDQTVIEGIKILGL